MNSHDLDDFKKEYDKWIKEIQSEFGMKNIQGIIGCCL